MQVQATLCTAGTPLVLRHRGTGARRARAGRFLAPVLGLCLLLSTRAAALPSRGSSAEQQGPPDITLTAAMRTEVIEGVLARLRASYVSPKVAEEMEAAIRNRMKSGEYDSVTSPAEFAAALTTHLQEVSHDKHLVVVYSRDEVPDLSGAGEHGPRVEEHERVRRTLSTVNFGFRSVAILDGNVGYLELVGFAPVDIGWDAAVAAMNLLTNTDALLIDLRLNGGGSSDMVALICTYLFDGGFRAIHLNDIHLRSDDSTRQYWTLPYVPGRRYGTKEVYLLTSRQTFSAAEEFAYDLKCLKRAAIVGEATGGGAHVGNLERINAHFEAFVPCGRSINPITKSNWESTGVLPDVEVPAKLAFKTAHVLALKKLIERATDDPTKERLKEALDRAEKELNDQKK